MQRDSEYNGETLGEKAQAFMKKLIEGAPQEIDGKTPQPARPLPFLVPSKALLKRLHKSSGAGRGRAHNGARTKPRDYEAKKKRRRAMQKASRRANRS